MFRSSESPDDPIDRILTDLAYLKSAYAAEAQKFGELEGLFEATRPLWLQLSNTSSSSVVESGRDYLDMVASQVRDARDQYDTNPSVSTDLVATGESFLVISGSTASLVLGEESVASIPVLQMALPPGSDPDLRLFLEHLEPNLAKTYDSVWECLHGTDSEPERSALYALRQVYDHMFGILAPNDEVRETAFWTKKEGDHTDRVDRRERIDFAADKWIRENLTRTAILAESKHMLAVYQEMNRAHKRGQVGREAALRTISEMCRLLRRWADAVESTRPTTHPGSGPLGPAT